MRLFLLVLLPTASACVPPCQQLCRKVLFDCDLDSERVSLDECIQSCERQDQLYLQWGDSEKRQLYNDHRRCISNSSCDELADGACYEGFEDLFIFDLDKVLPEQSDVASEGTGPAAR